jgi:hypothetical protein
MNCQCPFFGTPHPYHRFCQDHPHQACDFPGTLYDFYGMKLCAYCLEFLLGRKRALAIVQRVA